MSSLTSIDPFLNLILAICQHITHIASIVSKSCTVITPFVHRVGINNGFISTLIQGVDSLRDLITRGRRTIECSHPCIATITGLKCRSLQAIAGTSPINLCYTEFSGCILIICITYDLHIVNKKMRHSSISGRTYVTHRNLTSSFSCKIECYGYSTPLTNGKSSIGSEIVRTLICIKTEEVRSDEATASIISR